MEIEITQFFINANAYKFSGSIAERGQNAEKETWANAMREGAESPILKTEEELQALRDHAKNFGTWSDAEIAAWPREEINALFIQMVSADMREGGLDNDPGEIEWAYYKTGSERGICSGFIARSGNGSIYYHLGI